VRRAALVTGVTGQDGGYLVPLLLDQGVEVHGVVRPGDGAAASVAETYPEVTLHSGDVSVPERMSELVQEVAPDEIYNLAGISSVAFSWQEPVTTAEMSGLAVANLLDAAWALAERSGRSVRFVQASSAEIFGNPVSSPQDESTPVAPVNPYGAAKAYGHHLVGVYRGRGLHAVSAILYNHESPSRPATFVTRKITRGAAMIARGEADELVLGNLDARRDWGWAPDYVDAMVRAARHHTAQDYVIATGVAHSVREFVAAAFLAVGISDWSRHVRTDPVLYRPVDAVELVGDASRARSELGWRPTVGFSEMVSRMVATDLPPGAA
jgi:GDPmannose 4,6-dehydratase